MRDANRWVLRGIKVLSSIPIYALTDPVTSPIHAVQHHLSTLRARDLDRPLTGTNLCPFGDSKRTTHETLALASVGCWWDYVGAARRITERRTGWFYSEFATLEGTSKSRAGGN